MNIKILDFKGIEVYPTLVRMFSLDGGHIDSNKVTDILLAKISQQLECLLTELQRQDLLK